MTEETKVEVELHDEEINDIVEETLEEAAPAAKGAKGDEGAVTEPESIASVDKAADAVKSQAPVPKTKAGMINAMFTKMNGMSKAEMSKMYASYMGEGVEVEEGAEEVVAETIDTTAELNALVESEATLSDEFKAKTAVIFEAAVKTKLSEEVERIEDQYKSELAEEVSSIKEDLVGKVDSYLNYVVEQWMEENKLAIHQGLRTEIAETFMTNLKGLFVESYVDVPESKIDLVDDLADQVEELEEQLYKVTTDSIKLTEEVEQLRREAVIAEASEDLAETQAEKFASLVSDLDFEDEESFAQKVLTVKESYFSKTPSTEETSTELTEQADDPEAYIAEEDVAPSMERYLSAIRRVQQ